MDLRIPFDSLLAQVEYGNGLASLVLVDEMQHCDGTCKSVLIFCRFEEWMHNTQKKTLYQHHFSKEESLGDLKLNSGAWASCPIQ